MSVHDGSAMNEMGNAKSIETVRHRTAEAPDCRSCGACCSFSRAWPRFSLETDAQIEAIPKEFVDATLSGMRCEGDRCSALAGEVGKSTSCRIYGVRPDVCRSCEPGDQACQIARQHFEIQPC
jgi:Fe-S-cluster containining protein